MTALVVFLFTGLRLFLVRLILVVFVLVVLFVLFVRHHHAIQIRDLSDTPHVSLSSSSLGTRRSPTGRISVKQVDDARSGFPFSAPLDLLTMRCPPVVALPNPVPSTARRSTGRGAEATTIRGLAEARVVRNRCVYGDVDICTTPRREARPHIDDLVFRAASSRYASKRS